MKLLNTNELRQIFQKTYSIQNLTTKIELVLPTFKSWTVHKIVEYFTLAFEMSISTTASFFDPHCIGLLAWKSSSRRIEP